MARHDREDPHSLEDQLAWLDAIKEMPDEVEIAVSAVTSATLASPPASPAAEPEPASPYPADPWSLVPAEPASGGLFRATTESAYGAPVQEDAEAREASSTGPVRGSGFAGSAAYGAGDQGDSAATSAYDYGYGTDSGYGTGSGYSTDSGYGETAFVTPPEPVRPERSDESPAGSEEREESRSVESSTGPVRFSSFGSTTSETESGESYGSFGAPTAAFGTPLGTSTGPVSAPSFGSAAGSAADAPTPESPAASRDDEDDDHSEGALGRGAFSSPVDTDSYNIGAFSDTETRERHTPDLPSASEEPLRGWLEPAVPVEVVRQEDVAVAEPEESPKESPAPPEASSSFARSERVDDRFTGSLRSERTDDRFTGSLRSERTDDRFTGSLRDDLAAEERKPYEPGPAAVPTPEQAAAPEPAVAPDPAPERERPAASAYPPASARPAAPPRSTAEAAPVIPDGPVAPAVPERDAFAEREAYQSPRRPAPPVSAFSSPARATGPRTAGSKPNADSLDPVVLLRGRRNAPAAGWRRLVYKASAGLIKPGEAPEVRRRRELVQRARTPVATGHHRVAVLSLKGGVGKTTTTVGLGATLAQVRGDRVIAVDANPDRGTLSDKVELETSATVRDLLNERAQIKRYVDIRAFTSQTTSRLEILASDRDPSVSEAFSAKDYHSVAQVLENFYSICITDCGTGLLHSAMSGVLGMADQIVLVSSPSVDGARAASATLDWLEAHHYGDLVRSATVVLCSVRPRSKSTVDLDKLEAHFAARCRTVVRVPYDPHLEEGAEIDLDRLQQATQDAYLRLAASVGDGFAGPQALAERKFSEIPDHL
ncbi:AAA family ATPase [Microbispora sp. NBC_01189]|uniref:nucleotide-binding protein n=1 Tax=Microbispora sp. NBC_01189 TaxID=2903583 RepID=UPI002E14E460